MKLKGKAKFELTNVETGETRVVKEENMVTNGYDYLVQGSGIYDGSLATRLFNMANSTSSYYTAMSQKNYYQVPLRFLTNGLVLFSDRLEEDADHVYLTADDPDVTGVGADLAYIGEQTCAGSYNSVESGPIEGGYKHVWDFTTSQANGDIGCACLTNTEGAGLGFGLSKSVKDWKGNYNWWGANYSVHMPAFDDSSNAYGASRVGYFDEGRNLFIRVKNYYAFPNSSGSNYTSKVYNEPDINGNLLDKITFDKTFLYKKSIDFNVYHWPFDELSMFDVNYPVTEQRIGHSVNHCPRKLLRTVTVDMPSELAALIPDDKLESSLTSRWYWPVAFQCDEGFAYISFIIPKKSGSSDHIVEPGEKVYTWKIDMETFESTWFATTNTTGKSLSISYSWSAFSNVPFVTVSNNYTVLYEWWGNYGAWVIDNATGATIKEVCDAFDKPIKTSDYSMYSSIVSNDIVTYVNHDSNSTKCDLLMLNLKTGIMKYCRCNSLMGGYTSSYNYYSYLYGYTHGTKFPKMILTYTQSNYQYQTVLYYNPMMLMTINNLEDTVTKTSAETMRVTYIITEAEE